MIEILLFLLLCGMDKKNNYAETQYERERRVFWEDVTAWGCLVFALTLITLMGWAIIRFFGWLLG